MDQKSALLEAAKQIKKAIEGFVNPDEHEYIVVFESSPGHLRAAIGSNKFKDKSSVECQNLIWKYLRETVDSEYLMYCFGVHPMDLDEYEVYISSQDSVSSSADMFIRGATPLEGSDD